MGKLRETMDALKGKHLRHDGGVLADEMYEKAVAKVDAVNAELTEARATIKRLERGCVGPGTSVGR